MVIQLSKNRDYTYWLTEERTLDTAMGIILTKGQSRQDYFGSELGLNYSKIYRGLKAVRLNS